MLGWVIAPSFIIWLEKHIAVHKLEASVGLVPGGRHVQFRRPDSTNFLRIAAFSVFIFLLNMWRQLI